MELKNPGEFVPTEAPLEGELAAQLTEGSRLGLWPSLAPGGANTGLSKYPSLHSASGGGFSKEKPDPSDPAIAGPAPLCIKSP